MSNIVRLQTTLLLWGCLWVAPTPSLLAASLPTGFAETQVVSGLTSPTCMAATPDGRLLICQQAGELRVFKAGALLATPFVVVPAEVFAERGLVGVAVDPGYSTNGYIYVNYTAPTIPPHNVVVRYTASVANPDLAQEGSEEVIFDCDDQNATVHVGGGMAFGTDGKLYIAHGESGSGAGPQQLTSLYGKLLRINSDGSIPSSNPFYNTVTGKYRAIYAYGFRNPFSFAFQAETGRFFANDVGQQTYEEIDQVVSGGNYGWPNAEGPSEGGSINPIYAYGHGDGVVLGKSITGSTFYPLGASNFPASYAGLYFFGDYVNGWINVLNPADNSLDNFRGAEADLGIVDLDVGVDGALYVLARGTTTGSGVGFSTGIIRKIEYTGSLAPTITVPPSDATAVLNTTATFQVTASGTPPLAYQWIRENIDISGANAMSYTTPVTTLADDGAQFRCRVGNSYGPVTSVSARLIVSTNQLPIPILSFPALEATYNAGETLNFEGSATDTEDGVLPASAFSWRIDLHHDTHTHPGLPITSGVTQGNYTIPSNIEVSDNVWYRVYLFVTDSQGAIASTYREVMPNKVTLALQTVPTGLPLFLDSQPVQSSLTLTGVVGVLRTLGASPTLTHGGKAYNFVSWSDGGAAVHAINTPASATTYTAVFTEEPNTPPGVTVVAPELGSTYSAGQTFRFQGSATDKQEGVLDATRFSWQVDFHHSGNVDVAMSITAGVTNGFVLTSTHVDTDPNAFYRVEVAVTDSEGLVTTAYRDVSPNPSILTLQTQPPDLNALLLDGSLVVPGALQTSVVGVTRTLGILSPVTHGGKMYDFISWSDGGSASHSIAMPKIPTAYTATFREIIRNTSPVVTLLSPTLNATYNAGDPLVYSASATDEQDGPLASSAFTWRIEFYHSGQLETVFGPISDHTSGAFPIPQNVDPDPAAFYRLHLSVTDSSNLTVNVSRDLLPTPSSFTLQTQPAGIAALLLDGAPVAPGSASSGVVGVTRTLGVASPFTNGSTVYQFVSWSDDGAPTHTIHTPASAATYTATFATSFVNDPPMATLLSPFVGATLEATEILTFSGSATDAQDGPLSTSAFLWRVEFHHGSSVDAVLPSLAGTFDGNYIVPENPDPITNAFYRVLLTVTDSANASTTVSRDVPLSHGSVTLLTDPPGFPLRLDGELINTPFVLTGVVGVAHDVSANQSWSTDTKAYEFLSWSDDGSRSHTVTPSPESPSLTAVYRSSSVGSPIVNWGGDYLSVDTNLRGYDTPIEEGLDLDGDGTADDCRWACPFSDTEPLAPSDSSGGPSWKFYGGVLMHCYKATDFAFKWAEIWTWSSDRPNDVLHSMGPARSHGWDLRYWKKEDFLVGASNTMVRFGPLSTLELLDYAGGVSQPGKNSGLVRFVVRDANQFFISEDFGGPSNTIASFVLTDPGARNWAPYNPAPPHTLQFKASDAVFSQHLFTDVTAVGYLHSNDNVPIAEGATQAGFTLARVRVTAELSSLQTDQKPLLILRVLPENGHVVLSFSSLAGIVYTLLGSDNLKDWQPMQTVVGSGGLAEFEIDPHSGSAALFFQLRVD